MSKRAGFEQNHTYPHGIRYSFNFFIHLYCICAHMLRSLTYFLRETMPCVCTARYRVISNGPNTRPDYATFIWGSSRPAPSVNLPTRQ